MPVSQAIIATHKIAPTFSPAMITDGLVMNLDANYYSGSGSTWTDPISMTDFTLYNSPSWSSDNGGQFTFAAASQQWADTISYLPAMTSFTAQSWVKLNTLPASNELPCVVTEKWTGAGTKINYSLGFLNSSSQLEGGFFDSNGGYWNVLSATNSPQTGVWYNLTTTFDNESKVLKQYLGGKLISGVNGISGTPGTEGDGIRIARRWDVEQYLDATIKVINIWNRALSDSEVFDMHHHYRPNMNY